MGLFVHSPRIFPRLCFSFHVYSSLSLPVGFFTIYSFCSLIILSYTENNMVTLTCYYVIVFIFNFHYQWLFSKFLSSFFGCYISSCVGSPWLLCPSSGSPIILWGITWNWSLSSIYYEYFIKISGYGRHSKASSGKSSMISGNVLNSKCVLLF